MCKISNTAGVAGSDSLGFTQKELDAMTVPAPPAADAPGPQLKTNVLETQDDALGIDPLGRNRHRGPRSTLAPADQEVLELLVERFFEVPRSHPPEVDE